jgi:hypothetical protein
MLTSSLIQDAFENDVGSAEGSPLDVQEDAEWFFLWEKDFYLVCGILTFFVSFLIQIGRRNFLSGLLKIIVQSLNKSLQIRAGNDVSEIKSQQY